jgi:hypothetical protein
MIPLNRHPTNSQTSSTPVKSALVSIVAFLCALGVCVAHPNATKAEWVPAAHFEAIDVFVDPAGKPLGAYQIEFRATVGDVKLVGVEGGAHDAYRRAPYYDARALQQSRIIIAAYSTDAALPLNKTRVARLHVQVEGNVRPQYEIKLTVAGDRDAKSIPAEATYAPFLND